MRILGLDPGIATIGFSVVDGRSASQIVLVTCGCIRTEAGHPFSERLLEVHSDLLDIIDRHRPDVAAIEKLYFNKNVQTAISVSQTRGVLLLALAQRTVAVAEYGPLAVKKSVVGYGRATKSQVQAMVARILRLSRGPASDDASDAVAIALCHRFTVRP